MNYSNSQRAGVILYLTALIFGAYFEKVHLVKIRILDTNKEIIIDSSAISTTPLHESTISVKILGGGLNDFRFL